jgi:uncharacterized protein
MLRAVFDTNTILSAFLFSGPEAQAFDAVRTRQVQLVLTEALLSEYREVLSRAKFDAYFDRAGLTREAIFTDIETLAEMVIPASVPVDAVSDPKDLKVLACAVGGYVDVLVSGDKKHLLKLGSYAGIAILSTAAFLIRLSQPDTAPDDN